jgi:hypothetical protein
MKIHFKELASRLTGVSVPVFGVSWNPPEPERKVVRDVLVFLEDRRALYNDFAHEIEEEVAQSVLQIRSELTNAIRRLSEDAEAASSFRAMRPACREYLTNTRHRYPRFFGSMAELGRLRVIFRVHIAYLAIKYGIDIEGDLASTIPIELRETLPDNDEETWQGDATD